MIYTFESFFGEGDRPRIAASTSWHTNKVDTHSHTFYELVYVLSGFALHFCGPRSTLLTAGDMFLIPPGVEHSYVNPYRNGIVNFMFCPEDFRDVFEEMDTMPGLRTAFSPFPSAAPMVLHVDISERRSIENAFEKIRTERRERQHGWRTSLKMRIISLLIKYSRLYDAQICSGHTLTGGYSYVLLILEYVEKNYTGDISMENLANAAGLNPDYMSRKFKSLMGLSPSEYVRKFRVAKAMELLCTTDMTVAGIASSCGFSDVCLFSRVFKNITGITPVEFRKNGAMDME